jgi:hypothetical protein
MSAHVRRGGWGAGGTVAGMWIAPDVVDKAVVVLVDARRRALAVWKGRGRVDVYDAGGDWHHVSQVHSPDEEGLRNRTDMLGDAATTLVEVIERSGGELSPERTGRGLCFDVERLMDAHLVRATTSGYALWDGGETVDVYGRDGRHVCWAKVACHDLPTASQLMVELLALAPRLAARATSPCSR